MRLKVLSLALLLVSACAQKVGPAKRFELVLPADVPGYGIAAAMPAMEPFLATCPRLLKSGSKLASAEEWRSACASAQAVTSEAEAKDWLSTQFSLVRVDGGDALITGYYEPVFEASRTPSGDLIAPALTRPADLVAVDLGAFKPELAGQRIAGRVEDGRLRPYADRAAIDAAPPASSDVIAYMDPDDLFFLQIQGSGILDFGGEQRRIGYAGQNGHTYQAIGRTLVAEGHMALEDVTMQSIRTWLNNASPADAERIRHSNPSYIFFIDRGPAQDDLGPIGTAQVPLTPSVSVAVDPQIYPLGSVLFISGSNDAGDMVHGFHVAQDTGGAIKGAGRADLFTGRGDIAGERAGQLKLEAEMLLLLPAQAAARLTAPGT